MGLFGRKKKKEKIVDINNMRIFERYREDVGRAVARIDYDSMNAINANTGDTIEISCVYAGPFNDHMTTGEKTATPKTVTIDI